MKELPEQDAELFRQALDDVVPLAPSNRIARSRPARIAAQPPVDVHAIKDALSDHGAGDNAALEFLRPGLNRITLRKLRRGTWPPQDEIDLHGLSLDGARPLLAQFLDNAVQRGYKCVSVIHGKGWRSEGRDGILKVHTRHWLTQHSFVLGFCEAPLRAGGSGAVWVLLKNTRGVPA